MQVQDKQKKETFPKDAWRWQIKEDISFGIRVMRVRFDKQVALPNIRFVPTDYPIFAAQYEIQYLIAKQDKPHTIGETLVTPAVLNMANIMLRKVNENVLSQISLSNNTISRRIDGRNDNNLVQVVADLIPSFTKFSPQLDETTDVSNPNQLVFVSYVKDDVVKEDFLFCKPLITSSYSLCSAQACVGNKKLFSKTWRNIKICSGNYELVCAKECSEEPHLLRAE